MASYSARLEVNGQVYPVVLCSYGFEQAIDARGRISERMRHGLLELVLDVPAGDQLLVWAATPHYPLDGHVSFYQVSGLMASETVMFKAGQCIGYQEVFEAGADLVGSYRCSLTIAAAQLELVAGGPLSSSTFAPGAGGLAAAAGATVAAAQQARRLVGQATALVADPKAAVAPALAATAAPASQYLYREDNFPYASAGKEPGRLKSYIDAAGNLSPANPAGLATIQDHVRGSEPRKSDSPYTSTSAALNVGKSYGDHEIRIDHAGLAQGIARGEVAGVEIISNDQVVQHLEAKRAEAQARYDQAPSAKNKVRLARAQGDIENSRRDQEVLVKGVVPAKYVEVIKKSS
jgi:hypothetical protein